MTLFVDSPGPVEKASTADPDVWRLSEKHKRAAMTDVPPRVLLAGRPGAGKGTQGARLALRLGVQHLSTGELLRREIAKQSALGRAVERLVAAGRLVPTGLIDAIVQISIDGCGYVLDGYPRTPMQAKTMLKRNRPVPTVAIEIVVPTRVALERLIARGRPDDDPAVARERLGIYETETASALDWLDRCGLLMRVDGNASAEAVAHNVWRGFQHFRRACNGFSLSDAWIIGSTRDDPVTLRVNGEYANG